MWALLEYLTLLAVFCLPGYLLARVLCPRPTSPGFLLAAGFVFSLAAFALAAWPCLWLRIPGTTFWLVLALLWLPYSAVALVAHSTIPPVEAVPAREEPGRTSAPPTAGRPMSVLPSIALLAYLVLACAIARAATALLDPHRGWVGPEAGLLVNWLLLGCAAIPMLRRRLVFRRSLSEAPAPRLWTLVAWGMVAVLMIGAMLESQPQSDDAYYLSATARYTDGHALNREDPTLPGDGLPVAPHMRLLAWELFGATLCRLSGVPPLISHCTLLPPFLVLLASAAHWQLLQRFLSLHALAPLAMLGLCGYWLFGNSGPFSQGDCLLTRPWQGKSMLWVLGVPMVAMTLGEYLRSPSFRTWLAYLLGTIGALAMSTSAVFLLATLIPTLGAALALRGGANGRWPRFAAALAPGSAAVAYGLVLRSGFSTHPVLTETLGDGVGWRESVSHSWTEEGASVFAWLLILPVLTALLPTRRGWAYLVGWPLVLAATALNPLATPWMAEHLTSHHTYYRLFWLLPVGVALGGAIALSADFLAAPWDRGDRTGSATRLALVAAMVAALAALPDRFAWDVRGELPGNRGNPPRAANFHKIPADLLALVRDLERTEAAQRGRLLFPEHLGHYLAPSLGGLRIVSTRRSYTTEALTAAGRVEEAREREVLSSSLLRGSLDDGPGCRLLEKYQVAAILLDECPQRLERQLRLSGYSPTPRRGAYQLWLRSGPPAFGDSRR